MVDPAGFEPALREVRARSAATTLRIRFSVVGCQGIEPMLCPGKSRLRHLDANTPLVFCRPFAGLVLRFIESWKLSFGEASGNRTQLAQRRRFYRPSSVPAATS